jgi:hypothetical protein
LGTEINDIAVLISPTDEAVNVESPVLNWLTVNNSNYYNVQVSTTVNFSNIQIEKTIPSTVLPLIGLSPNTKYFWRVRAMNNAVTTDWSDTWEFTTAESNADENEQTLLLNSGWNMISTFILPDEPDMEFLFDAIKDDIAIVKNNLGEVYIPAFEINQIGDWDINQAYQVFITQNAQMTINGTKAKPDSTYVHLNAGWNMISYLRDSPMDIEEALETLINDEALVIAKDNLGNVFIPQFEINSIGDMISGQGYQIFLVKNSMLLYPQN